jgi:outer membrane protein assembly factor BamB
LESFLRRSSICSVGVLWLFLAARLPAQVPPPPQEEEQEETEAEAPKEKEAKAKGEPKPPDGILPVGEVARLSFAPSELPKVMLHGDRLVVVTASGGVEGHDALTGEFRWKLGLPGETLFEPVLHRVDPFEIVLSSASGRLFIVDAATGEIRRELQLPCELALAPLVALPFLYVGTAQGELLGIDGETGAERFRASLEERPAALAAAGDTLVASGSERTLVALNAGTGAEAWRFRGRSGFLAPAVFASDRLYIGNDAGEFYSLSLENGGVRFRWPTGASVRYPALVDNRVVYVTSYGNDLYAYQAGGGAELLRVSLPGRPASGPVRFGRRLVVVTFDGAVVEVDPEKAEVSKVHQSRGDLASRPAFLPAAPSPGTNWYAAQRIALSLRTGEVLLLAHQGKAEEEPEESTDETPEETKPKGKKKPKPPPEDSVSRK